MDFMNKNLFLLLIGLFGLLSVQASKPGFEIKIGKSWETDNVSYVQYDGEINNASKLKINNWYIEIPYNKGKNKLHGNWGCEIEEQADKIILTGGDVNGVIKVSTVATFGFIVSDPDKEFNIEKAVLYTKNKEIPVHSKPEDSEDEMDMNVDLPFEDNRYFPESMDIKKLKDAATAMSVSEVKEVIFKELVEHWDVIKAYLKNDNMLKVFALFLGWATRESTLNAGVETAFEDGFGVNSAHAYGPFQTAVTAFYGCDPSFDLEDDVKEIYWYTLNEKNFCDPYISTHMGIRKLIHFVIEAENFGVTGLDVVRSALKGFNSGHATPMQENETFHSYCDEIGSLGHWYYETGHYEDDEYTWTGDSRCDRNDPWGWWENDDPLPKVEIPVHVRNPEDGTETIYTVDNYPKAETSSTPAKTTTTTSKTKPTSSNNEKCWAKDLGFSCCQGCEVTYTDNDGDWGLENGDWCGIIEQNCKQSNSDKTKCFTEEKGMDFPCCQGCEVYYTDDDGEWGFENNQWCGINSETCSSSNVVTPTSKCFTEEKGLGFPCCQECTVVTSDDDGDWGVENNEWCGIPNSCY
jgi:hypothetical protein